MKSLFAKIIAPENCGSIVILSSLALVFVIGGNYMKLAMPEMVLILIISSLLPFALIAFLAKIYWLFYFWNQYAISQKLWESLKTFSYLILVSAVAFAGFKFLAYGLRNMVLILGLFSMGILWGCESKTINSESSEKEVVLVATREASSGGILLKLFDDKTFELGTLRKVRAKGIYKFTADSLFLSTTDNSKLLKNFSKTTFIVKDRHLIEVNNTGIRFLEIQTNKFK